MRKFQLLFAISILASACGKKAGSDNTESLKAEFNRDVLKPKRNFYVAGEIYGNVEHIQETLTSSTTREVTKYEYHFYKDQPCHCVYFYEDNQLEYISYYNKTNQLDSVVNKYGDYRTTYYYHSPFSRFDPKYSRINNSIVDSVVYTYDTLNRTSTYFSNGKMATTNYIDSLGRITKSYSHDFNGYTRFKYNERGYLEEEYISSSDSTSKLKSLVYSYEYDQNNNWTRKEIETKYNNQTSSVLTYKRAIKYR
ncbi:MAG TPA: hypothetical protein VIT44_12960 [Cyclobacteriaceae bacterium]